MTGREAMEAAPLTLGPAPAELATVGHAYIRLRDPKWGNPEAYARFSVVLVHGERHLGPWMHLFDRRTQEVIGEPTPQPWLIGADPGMRRRVLEDEHEVYTGPLDPADTP